MEFQGKLHAINIDWVTNKLHITFECDDTSTVNEAVKLKDIDKLTVKVVKYRKKRSLDANAYCWTLISKLAESMTPPISKEECYELMLCAYGTNETDEQGNIVKFSVLADIDISKMGVHCAFIGNGHVGDKLFSHYRLIKGSSQYDTKEMSIFIDGIVSECKEQGIETMTPDELARLKESWKGYDRNG